MWWNKNLSRPSRKCTVRECFNYNETLVFLLTKFVIIHFKIVYLNTLSIKIPKIYNLHPQENFKNRIIILNIESEFSQFVSLWCFINLQIVNFFMNGFYQKINPTYWRIMIGFLDSINVKGNYIFSILWMLYWF